MSTVYKIEKLIADLGEEDYYNENIIDERLGLTAEETPTEDLYPTHYKTLREMIDFIKKHNKLNEINASIDNSLHKGSSNIIEKLQKEIKELKNENSEIKRECLKTIKETDMTLDYWNKTHKKEIEELKEENKRIKDYNKKYSDIEKLQKEIEELKKANFILNEEIKMEWCGLEERREVIMKIMNENNL